MCYWINITRNIYYLEEKFESRLVPDANIDFKQMVKIKSNLHKNKENLSDYLPNLWI